MLTIDHEQGQYTARYAGHCGYASDCPLVAVTRCLSHAAINAREYGWFADGRKYTVHPLAHGWAVKRDGYCVAWYRTREDAERVAGELESPRTMAKEGE